MGTADRPTPAMDEECSSAWQLIGDNQYGGNLPEITEEIIPRSRGP